MTKQFSDVKSLNIVFMFEYMFCNTQNLVQYSMDYLFPKQEVLDSSKLKEFADDNFKFVENSRKISKWVENTGGKGEIARAISPFPLIFSKDLYCRHVKTRACLGKGYTIIFPINMHAYV